jgi:hypothetical protein
MNILQLLQRFRDDFKAWVTANLKSLDKKIDDKTFPVDAKLSSTSKNPVQNKIINAELDDLKSKVGSTPVANQISAAIAKYPHFSGDYNDLVNAPNIIDDETGDLTITDDSGNIIFKVDTDGIHSTTLTLDGSPAATEEYVDKAIATNVDFTGYATEKLVEQSIENVKTELSESIISESNEWKIVDGEGNIIFNVDDTGAHTTGLSLNGEVAATEKYVDDAIAKIPTTDLSDYYNKEETDNAITTAKEELSESIVAESDEWKVVDEAGNIIFSVDATGAHTTELTLNGESAATESYVDTKVADLVNSAPEALNTLGELATALENHEDAYDALLETVGAKATKIELEAMKSELSESIVSETDEWKVVDNSGNIIFSVDADGAHTTSMTLNGQSVEDMIDDKVDKVAGKSLSTNDFTDAYKDKLDSLENMTFEESDPTVPAWAKEANKPSYAADEVGALPNTTVLADLADDTTHRTVTDVEKQQWNAKSNFSGDYNDLTNAPAIAEDETGDLVIADNAGNIIFRASDQGLETTHLSIGSLTINGMTIQEMVKAYVEEAILGGEW